MNAMALNPLDNILIDPFEGQKDIASRVIRAVGDPLVRFAEDKLRMLRAVRFASVLSFSIEDETLQAVEALARDIKTVSMERITAEIEKLLLSPVPSTGIEFLRETGLLEVILPELLEGWGMEQNRHHEFTVYYHTMKALDSVPPEPTLRWAALLHDISKPRTKQGEHFYGHEKSGAKLAGEIMLRLKLPNRTIKAVTHLIRHHMINYNPKWSGAAVRRLINRVGADALGSLLELHKADMEAKGVTDTGEDKMGRYNEFRRRVEDELRAGRPATVGDLAVNSHDIAAVLGGSGPFVGKVLTELLKQVVERPEMNNRDDLLSMAREMTHWLSPTVVGKLEKSDSADSDDANLPLLL
jgi:poly(A) polymerase/tRNA nucleotidyltransferase (CCA-adding enzyme)